MPIVVGTVSGADALCALTAPGSGELSSVDVVEARLDGMTPADAARCLDACRELESRGTPTLVTVRAAAEGGAWRGTEAERRSIYERALLIASWIDVELQELIAADLVRAAHSAGKKVILSFHDFHGTPPVDRLLALAQRGRAMGGDLIKIATSAAALGDVQILIEVLAQAGGDGRLAVIGMGTLGQPLRLFLPAVGSALAYGFIDRSAASGQLPVVELRRMLAALLPGFEAHRTAL